MWKPSKHCAVLHWAAMMDDQSSFQGQSLLLIGDTLSVVTTNKRY